MRTKLVKTINDSFARKKELEKELLERMNNNQPLNDTYSKIQELDSIINNALKNYENNLQSTRIQMGRNSRPTNRSD